MFRNTRGFHIHKKNVCRKFFCFQNLIHNILLVFIFNRHARQMQKKREQKRVCYFLFPYFYLIRMKIFSNIIP